MDRNPYDPPASVVADTSDVTSKRPIAIAIASASLLVALFQSCYSLILIFPGVRSGLVSGSQYAGDFLPPVLLAVLTFWIFAGRNWARLGFFVFYLVNVAMVLRIGLVTGRLAEFLSPWGLIVLTHPLQLIAVVLLVGPGRRWFAPR